MKFLTNKTKKWIVSTGVFILGVVSYYLLSIYTVMIAMSHLNWKEQNPEAKLTVPAKIFYYLIKKITYILAWPTFIIPKKIPTLIQTIILGILAGIVTLLIFLIILKLIKKLKR